MVRATSLTILPLTTSVFAPWTCWRYWMILAFGNQIISDTRWEAGSVLNSRNLRRTASIHSLLVERTHTSKICKHFATLCPATAVSLRRRWINSLAIAFQQCDHDF